MSDSTSRRKPSGAMASIIERGQENVGRLEATFRAAPVTELPTDYLSESRNNTRRRISEASIRDMVNGIVQAEGEILQPLLVRPIPVSPEGHRYEVICGNRRLNAARRLDLKLVPVRVREMSDETATRFALWENLSREDLSPMDLAEAISDLRRIDRLSWDEIGERFGFTRQWGWQQQKLAELPAPVRDMTRDGELSVSSATLIATSSLSADQKLALAIRVVGQKLSYRATSELARCKGAFTSREETSADAAGKDTFTWTPPVSLKQRRYARLRRATEEVVGTYNKGLITREYAASLREMAENLIRIADGTVEGYAPGGGD